MARAKNTAATTGTSGAQPRNSERCSSRTRDKTPQNQTERSSSKKYERKAVEKQDFVGVPVRQTRDFGKEHENKGVQLEKPPSTMN